MLFPCPQAWLMDQMDSTGCNKPWKLLWKWTAIPGCLSDNINVYLRWHITAYTRVWEHESVRTATCWLLVSAAALSMSSLANSPYLPYHAQSMRRKPKLSSSTLVHSHDSFHIPFSFKQLQDRMKTLMSGFSQVLVTYNQEKKYCLQMQNNIIFFFFPPAWNTPMRYTEAALQRHSSNINSRTVQTPLYCLSEGTHQISSLRIKSARNHCLILLGRFRFPGKSTWSRVLFSVSKGDQSVISISVGIHLTVYGAEKSNGKGLSSIQ